MKRISAVGVFACVLLAIGSASAQWSPETHQFDVGFGVGTLLAPYSSSNSSNRSAQGIGGGAYLAFSGDYLLWRHFGIEGEVAWRASQNLYYGNQPFRPIFYDFNALFAPPLGKHAQLELLGGIGGLSTRFYTQTYTCDLFTYSCTNYVSSNHFMADVGVGLRLYVHNGFFVRPEYRGYFVHNNVEFNSGYAARVGATIGYSFGRQ